jgi:phospholipid/cholesterol/gamma-HCH transport system permease protein
MMHLARSHGAAVLLLSRTAATVRHEGVRWRAFLEQLHELVGRSAVLVTAGMAFFGTVIVTIAYAQARKYTGNITLVGPAYFELMVREFGPLTVALLLASRAGASTSAELAAMKVNEQIDALRLSAIDPLAELMAPRVLACAVGLPLLTLMGTSAAAIAAALTVTWSFGADGAAFLDPRFVDTADVACAAVKAVLCGVYIPLAAGTRALAAQGGAQAVGRAVTTGVVEACMGCLLIDFVIAVAFWGLGR